MWWFYELLEEILICSVINSCWISFFNSNLTSYWAFFDSNTNLSESFYEVARPNTFAWQFSCHFVCTNRVLFLIVYRSHTRYQRIILFRLICSQIFFAFLFTHHKIFLHRITSHKSLLHAESPSHSVYPCAPASLNLELPPESHILSISLVIPSPDIYRSLTISSVRANEENTPAA